jgi:hypothetical protein
MLFRYMALIFLSVATHPLLQGQEADSLLRAVSLRETVVAANRTPRSRQAVRNKPVLSANAKLKY